MRSNVVSLELGFTRLELLANDVLGGRDPGPELGNAFVSLMSRILLDKRLRLRAELSFQGNHTGAQSQIGVVFVIVL